MTELSLFADLVPLDHGLCVVSMARRDGTIASAVVNAGILSHPQSGVEAVGFVARGLRKLEHLRGGRRATIVARAGWRWAAAEGAVEVFGPDDEHPGIDGEALRRLLRDVFAAAGGTHEDWDEYDRVMAEDRSAAVLLTPDRVYGTPAG